MHLTTTGFDIGRCISVVSDPIQIVRPITAQSMTFWDEGSWSVSVFRQASTANVTTITQGLAVAEGYVVAWQEKELFLFPTDYATSLARRIGSPWGSSTALPASTSSLPPETSPPSPSLAPTPSSTGLSTGSKVGIAVGAVAGALLGAIVLWAYLWRRKKRNQVPQTTEIEGTPTPEMADQDEELAGRKWYLGGRWRSEVRTEEPAGELDSTAVQIIPRLPVELDASNVR